MATATDLERLVIQLSADVRTYQKSLDRARGATNRTARDIESRFNKMSKNIAGSFKSFAGGFIGGFGVTQLATAIGGVVEKMADLADEAERAGVSAEGLQALGFVARQNGVEIDTLSQALKKLNLEVGKAQATQKGGLFDIFQANQKTFSTDPFENFRTVSDLIRNARNEQDKAVIGAAAFGKAYAEIIPLLNLGAEAIKKGEESIRAAGGVLSNELVAKAKEFSDRWTAAWDLFAARSASAILQTLAGLELIAKHPGLINALRLNPVTGPIISGADLFRQAPLGTPSIEGRTLTEQQQRLLDVTKRRLEVETQIQQLRTQGGGGDPRLPQLEKELEVLKQQTEVLKEQVRLSSPETGFRISRGTGPAATIVPPGGDGADAIDELSKTIDRFVKVVIDFESKGNVTAKNPLSSATGLGQFIESTWLDMFKRHFPDRAKNLSDAAILALRNDADTSIALIKAYATDNAAILQKAGVAVTEANLQLSHFLGPGGALKVLQAAPGTPIENVLGPEVIAANRGVLAGKTTDEVIREANARAGLSGAIRDNNEALRELEQSNNIDIDQMKVRQAELGATTEASKIYARELELLNQLQQKGIPITDELRAQVHELAVKWGEQAQTLQNVQDAQDAAKQSAQDLAEAQKQAAQTMDQIGQAFGGALQGFISDLASGKKLTDALRDSLLKLGESLLNIALDNLFSGGAQGGGILGGLFGGGGAGGILGGLFHEGGIAGHATSGRLVRASAFANARRYHGGGFAGLAPGEVPAILKRNEPILPNMETLQGLIAAARSGSGSGYGGERSIVQNVQFIAPDIRTMARSRNQLARSAGTNLERVKRTL